MRSLRTFVVFFLLLFLFRSDVPAAEDVTTENNPENTLSVFVWKYAIDPESIRDFEKEFSVKIRLNYYRSGQEMVARLLSGSKGFDVAIVPDRFVRVLADDGLLEKLEKGRVPNGSHIHPHFNNVPFDPNQEYSMPYLWGTMGIAYRTDKIKEAPDSWEDIFNPNENLKGHIALLDDPRGILGAALKYRGYSFNTTSESRLQEAVDTIEEILPYVGGFLYDFDKEDPEGKIWVAVTWSGIAYGARKRGKPIRYIVPKEGSNTWVDSMVILRDSPNKKIAYEFLNYILRPRVGARLANTTGYSTPNLEAMKYVRADLKNEKGIYPPDEVLARCEYTGDLGKSVRLFYNFWRRLKRIGREVVS